MKKSDKKKRNKYLLLFIDEISLLLFIILLYLYRFGCKNTNEGSIHIIFDCFDTILDTSQYNCCVCVFCTYSIIANCNRISAYRI